MHARVAQYTFKPGQGREAVRRAERGLLPLFQAHRGFRGYWVILADDDLGFSITIWDSEQQASDAVQAAATWVANNVADMILSVDDYVGELAFARLSRNALD
jgi:heme-degrading monooxygenase HmoA